VVECWDSDDDSIVASKIDSILEILHHPAFAQATRPTFIQGVMFNIVKSWWNERTSTQLITLREDLSKEGIERNSDGHLHGDNNAVRDASDFTGTGSYAFDWEGSRPKLTDRPGDPLLEGAMDLLREAAAAIERAQVQLEEGARQAGDIITVGIALGNEAVNQVVDDTTRLATGAGAVAVGVAGVVF